MFVGLGDLVKKLLVLVLSDLDGYSASEMCKQMLS